MVGKVFNEFLGHHTAEEAASQLRKSCKDRWACVHVIVKTLSIHRNNYKTIFRQLFEMFCLVL